jgi:hypothetical protein
MRSNHANPWVVKKAGGVFKNGKPRVTILLFDGLSCVEENEAEPASTTRFPGQPDQPREVPSLRQRGALRWVESASCDGELAHFLPHEARTIPLSADL